MATDWDETTSVVEPPATADKVNRVGRAHLIVLQGSSVGEMYQVIGPEQVVGRGAGADVRLADEGISRFHCKLLIDGGSVVLEDLESRNGTFCNGERVTGRRALREGDKLQLGTTSVLRFTFHDKMDESFQRRMFDAALRDSLTRAYNKRYLVDRLHSEVRFALRHRTSLSLIMMDLDHFKQVNDLHGHPTGDRVLAEFAGHIHDSIRHEDVLARFGGEEFALVSRSVSPADTLRLAERLRRSTGALVIAGPTAPVQITMSVGVATLDELRIESADELVGAADAALYEAKHDGRNRVVVATQAMVGK